jgi:hypothetical protein
MKVQIIRNNSNTTLNNTPTTTTTITSNTNTNNNKIQDEINPQLADPAIVAKVSIHIRLRNLEILKEGNYKMFGGKFLYK